MATDNIPPPPILGPQPTFPVSTVPPGALSFVVFTYELDKGGWTQYGASFADWDALPLGYYRTQANYPGIPMFVYVSSRHDPGGVWLGAVIAPQDSPTVQGADCPDGYGDVPVSELNLPSGVEGNLAPWLVGDHLAQLCAVLAVIKVPTCPPGFTWDPVTETCKANPIITIPICPAGYHYDLTLQICVPDVPDHPPPPTCPPGYTWDPVSQTCQPTTPPQGPPPCPPFTTLPDCLPTPPPSDPDQDEVGDLAVQLAYWLEIGAIYLMNLFEVIKKFQPGAGGGTGANPDPVTCTQLTSQISRITDALTAIASVLATVGGTGGTAPDLTTVVQGLKAIADAITAQGTPAADPNVKRIADTLNGFPPDEPGAADQISALIDWGVKNYGFPSDLAQLWKS